MPHRSRPCILLLDPPPEHHVAGAGFWSAATGRPVARDPTDENWSCSGSWSTRPGSSSASSASGPARSSTATPPPGPERGRCPSAFRSSSRRPLRLPGCASPTRTADSCSAPETRQTVPSTWRAGDGRSGRDRGAKLVALIRRRAERVRAAEAGPGSPARPSARPFPSACLGLRCSFTARSSRMGAHHGEVVRRAHDRRELSPVTPLLPGDVSFTGTAVRRGHGAPPTRSASRGGAGEQRGRRRGDSSAVRRRSGLGFPPG
jgi:hypothetical protein